MQDVVGCASGGCPGHEGHQHLCLYFDCISILQELHIATAVKNETWMHKQEKKIRETCKTPQNR